MRMVITSFSAGFHAKNNIAPLLEEIGGEFVSWHQRQKFEKADVIYCLGWYVSSMQSYQQHMNLLKYGVPVIIHWAGSDVLTCREFGSDVDISDMWEALNQDFVVHLAGRPALIGEVRELGVRNVKQCHVASRKIFKPEPFPIKQGGAIDHLITTYIPPTRLEFFNFETVYKVSQKLPDIPFITCSFSSPQNMQRISDNFTDWGKLTDTYLEHLMYASTIHLRIVEHDGCSLSLIENAMAGRRIVTNMEYPRIPPVKKDVDSIVETIEEIMEVREPNLKVAEYYAREFGQKKYKNIITGILVEKGVLHAGHKCATA